MTLTKQDAKQIVENVLSTSKADEVFVSLEGVREANLRFARNEITTSGDAENATLTVQTTFGKRSGAATANQFDAESIERVVRNAEETAKFAPEDPEHMPLLGPQQYASIEGWDSATADAPPSVRAKVAAGSIAAAKSRDVQIAGFLTNAGTVSVIADSKGLFGFHPSTRVTYSATARTADGTGSGWAGLNGEKLASVDPLALSKTAVEKAYLSRNPKELAPGTHTVILEPAAVADLLLYMTFSAQARSADEGRSFFSKKGGGNRIGEKVLSESVNIWTDPADPRAPGSPFSESGLPTRKMQIVENGVLKSLVYSRFWADKMKTDPTPDPVNLIMKGASGSVDDLVRGTKDGVLVTRFWYIRFVDPQTILLTGLTRDGTYRILNGKIAYAVKNFRWNDSPISAFSKVDAMSREMRTRGTEAEDFSIVCPAIRTEFNFSSLSEAV